MVRTSSRLGRSAPASGRPRRIRRSGQARRTVRPRRPRRAGRSRWSRQVVRNLRNFCAACLRTGTSAKRIIMKLKELGKVPLCNHRADRGIYIHGFCLPLCARCTGLLLGSIAGTAAEKVSLQYYKKRHGKSATGEAFLMKPQIKLAVGTVFLVPTAIDGLVEYAAEKESTNHRRLTTGLLGGLGCTLIESGVKSMGRKGRHPGRQQPGNT